jgi:hypothetical protein
MEKLACPGCGSELFCIGKGSEKKVFRIFDTIEPEALQGDIDGELLRRSNLHCGSCSWQGEVSELVPSMM